MKILKLIFPNLALIMLVSVSAIAVKTYAHSTSSQKESEINFHQGTWNEALEMAKTENKMVFLNISASWCGPCKLLKAKTFTDSEAGAFYNANFINVAVDGEIGEGITLAQKYAIKGYPTLLFVDENGKLVAQTAGYHNPQKFIELGKQITQK